MKVKYYLMSAFVTLTLIGCGGGSGDKNNASSVAAPGNLVAAQKNDVVSVTGPVSGEFRLVKVEGSQSVYLIKDGKKSAITSWGWVERNAPTKNIETIAKSELDSFTGTNEEYK